MFEKDIMNKTFEKIKGETKQSLISVFGKPHSTFFSFVVYKNTDMYMVLYFEEVRNEKTFSSCLKGASFFDERKNLIWSGGINLVPEYVNSEIKQFTKVSELIKKIGEPHGVIGESFSALQYLSENGKFILVKHNGDDIIDISYNSL